MAVKKSTILLNTVKKLVRHEAKNNLFKLIEKTRPEDLAHVLARVPKGERRFLFETSLADLDLASRILRHLEEEPAREILLETDSAKLGELLEKLPSDDAASLLNLLPEERKGEVLDRMSMRRSAGIEEILTYRDGTAGSIMDKSFFALPKTLSAREVIERIKTSGEKENLFYLYAINEAGQLVGVISLRQLFMADDTLLLKDIMNPDVITTRPHTDQEEVARLISKYDLVSIPVVDEYHRIIGIVTVDDIIDIIHDETTEDMYKMAGLSDEQAGDPAMKSARKRSLWLLANLLIDGLIVSEFIRGMEDIIKGLTILAGFIPVITATAGSAGNQSSTVMIRGLATGRIDLHAFPRFFIREIKVGLLIGLLYGLGLFLYIFLRDGFVLNVGVVVGLSLLAAILVAAASGSIIPVLMYKIGIDPAVSSVPFVTAFMDITGVVIYFSVAKVILTSGIIP